MKSILTAINKGNILVSDGAWGTLLQAQGLKAGECPEEWNISHPQEVFSIAQKYIQAGSNIILTNSFGGSPYKLGKYGLANDAAKINEEAAKISRSAAGEENFVLGSIGPTGLILMMEEIDDQTVYDGFYLQAKALMNGGVDAILIETMSALDEAILAVKAAKDAANLEVICTFTFEKTNSNEFKTMMGVSPQDMTKALIDAGVSVIGANCGNGFDQMIEIVKEIKSTDSGIPLLVHANAGIPIYKDGQNIFPETPEMMAEKVSELIECGVNIIGGCCGTNPKHIEAIASKVKELNNRNKL